MKNTIAALLVSFFCLSNSLNAQKIGFIDTQYILENLPEYKSAQQQLDRMSLQWQKEVEAKFAEIDKMYRDFQAEAVLLTDDMRKKREEEIIDKEKAAKLVVPSAENLLGSNTISGVPFNPFCLYNTDWFCNPSFLLK